MTKGDDDDDDEEDDDNNDVGDVDQLMMMT